MLPYKGILLYVQGPHLFWPVIIQWLIRYWFPVLSTRISGDLIRPGCNRMFTGSILTMWSHRAFNSILATGVPQGAILGSALVLKHRVIGWGFRSHGLYQLSIDDNTSRFCFPVRPHHRFLEDPYFFRTSLWTTLRQKAWIWNTAWVRECFQPNKGCLQQAKWLVGVLKKAFSADV